jgi:hypothetical protein
MAVDKERDDHDRGGIRGIEAVPAEGSSIPAGSRTDWRIYKQLYVMKVKISYLARTFTGDLSVFHSGIRCRGFSARSLRMPGRGKRGTVRQAQKAGSSTRELSCMHDFVRQLAVFRTPAGVISG